MKTSLDAGCSDIDLSCLWSWWWWWSCASTPSPAWPAPVAMERRGRERRTRILIFISWERWVTSQYYHGVTMSHSLSQLSRTGQLAPDAHVTVVLYKIMLILIMVDISPPCVSLLAASQSLVSVWCSTCEGWQWGPSTTPATTPTPRTTPTTTTTTTPTPPTPGPTTEPPPPTAPVLPAACL